MRTRAVVTVAAKKAVSISSWIMKGAVGDHCSYDVYDWNEERYSNNALYA